MKKYLYLLFCTLFICVFFLNADGQIITTIAGNGILGFGGDGGPATAASFNGAMYVAVDGVGNMYIDDVLNYRVRKISAAGIISTIVGTGTDGFTGDGGPATAAEVSELNGVAVDIAGNIYISDSNHIRKINTSGIITTIAGNGAIGYSGDGGQATAAAIAPGAIATDSYGNIYFNSNGVAIPRIRKINTSGIITTIAGGGFGGDGGPATAASIIASGIVLDASGNIYITTGFSNTVRKINTSGNITTIAGTGFSGPLGDGGPATAATFSFPEGIAIDGAGNIFIGDVNNGRVRKIDNSGIITTYAGTGAWSFGGDGGPATAAQFNYIIGLAVDGRGNLNIADIDNYRIRKIKINRSPYFIAGASQILTLCENSSVDSINKLLAVIDSDLGQTETWSAITLPLHGALYSATTKASTGDTVVPWGLSYTPIGGYNGNDSFKVKVTDGYAADTITIYVTINPICAIAGSTTICLGQPIVLSDSVIGGIWTSGKTTNATIGSGSGIVTGVATGTASITYIMGTGCSVATTVTVNAAASAITGALIVCASATTTLSDAGGGTWSSSSTSLATISGIGIVTGISAGTATITYILSTGCKATAAVTVNTAPTVIAGASTICAGAASALSDGISGGAWSSSNTTIGTVGSAGILTGISAGTATITYTLTAGCMATKAVTVNPLSPVTGAGSVCVGATLPLSDAVTGGTWTSTATTIATVSGTGVVTGVALGSATIVYTLPTGCTASTTVTVSISPTSITGVLTVCSGSTIALSDGVAGGTWSSSKTTIATAGTTGIVTGVAGGTATISYSLGTGCTVSQTVTVNTAPTPVTGSAAVCIGGSISMSDGVSGGAWTSSNTGVATISSGGTVSGIISGTTTISYTLTGGCLSTKIISVNPTPTPITGASMVCVGSSILLSDAISGGSWSPAVGAVVTVGTATGVVTGISAGTATVTYSLGASCAVAKTVTVNPVSPITGVPIAGGICVGQTATLSDATPGGAWNSSNIAIAAITFSGVVSGVSAGTATITYTMPTGCTVTTVITVNSLAPAITGAMSVCLGATTILSDASSGTWSSSGGATTVGPATGIVTGKAVGTGTVTFSIGTGCNATTVVTVNALPAAITGASSVCAGATITLSDAPGGSWGSPDLTVWVDAATGNVTGLSAGTATVSYTAATGCVATKTITVNPLPFAISGSGNVCIGATTTLSDAGGGTWSGSGSAITIGTTGLVTGKAIGTATVSYTLPTGCSTTITMTVNALPSAITGAASVCGGTTITLSDSPAGGTWSSPGYAGIVSVGLTIGTVTGISGGTAVITYTMGAGCTTTKTVTVNPAPAPITGVKNLCEGGATLFVYDADTPKGIWSATLITITSGGLVTTTTPGAAMVTYTLPTGCYTTAGFSVNPLPLAITGINFVCTSSTITLSDATTGGTWAASGGIATISSAGVVSGRAAGTAVITYTLPTGCMTRDTITIYPTPNPITGLSNVCLSATTTFSDSLSGGLWSTSSGGIAAVSGAGAVSGIAVGKATITYTTTGSCIAVKPVTVLPLPDVYTVYGGGSFCAGDTGVHVKLNWSATGFKYLLYDGSVVMDSLNGKGDSLDYGLQTTGGIYTVVSVNKVTGCSINMTGGATVTVIPLATPGINILTVPGDTVCDGTPVTYTAIPVNGGTHPTYQWRINGILISDTFNNYGYTPVYADVVTALMTSNAACATPVRTYTSVPMSVVAPVAPAITITADPGINIGKGQSVTFMATVTNGVPALTYQWLVNNVAMAGETHATFTSSSLADSDVVSCEVTSNGICVVSATAAGMQMDVSSEGVTSPRPSPKEREMVSVFPNPNEGVFWVNLLSDNNEPASIIITNIVGEKIKGINTLTNTPVPIKLDVAAGVYLISGTTVHGKYVVKVTVNP